MECRDAACVIAPERVWYNELLGTIQVLVHLDGKFVVPNSCVHMCINSWLSEMKVFVVCVSPREDPLYLMQLGVVSVMQEARLLTLPSWSGTVTGQTGRASLFATVTLVHRT